MKRSHSTQLVLAISLALAAASAQAQTPAPAPAVDPAAVTALDAMSTYLRNLKSFQVQATTTTDEVLDDGQKIQYEGEVNIVARMPDRLWADVSGDRKSRIYAYDGKTFTLYARRMGYYAQVPAPPTLRELDDLLSEKYDIEIPLADLFRFGGSKWGAADLKAAAVVGPSGVDGISCAHYAYRVQDLDFELWIQLGDNPLPRKIVITTTTDASKPQYSATYTWNLAPSYDEATFTFTPPKSANKIVLAAVEQ